MKYCLNCRVSHEYLQKADQLFVEYRDIDYIDTLIENYPAKLIILDIPSNIQVDWQTLRKYNILSKYSFMLRLHKLNKPFIDEAKNLEIPFFFAYPINSFYDLKYVADLGVSYVYLEAPIFFDMPNVKKFNIPVRLVPQMANNSTWSFVRDKAPFGSWIRPENMIDYEEYAEVVDFSNPPYNHLLPKQEEAYYRIYHDKKAWPGDIRAIIQDLGIYSLNRLIPTDVLHARLSCGQRCQSGGICRICERVLDFAAQEEELKEYKEMRENGELKTLEQLEEEELGYGEGRSSEAESN